MALNPQTFKTRSLTALVFVVVMLSGLLWNRWSFFVLFSIIHFGCWIEYQRLITSFYKEYAAITPFHRYGVIIAGWCMLLFFTYDQLTAGPIRLSQTALWAGTVIVVLVPVTEWVLKKGTAVKTIALSLFGLLYISLSMALLIEMRNHWPGNDNRLNVVIPLLVIFSLWINDTMAYIVGSFIGKTPLSKVSPKKTWEGTIGGIILSVLTIGGIAYFTHYLAPVPAMIIAGIAAISGTYGDLFESKLKRMAGVKDSGRIMPGHGGFLDRFDSLLFAGTAVWLYVSFFLY